MLNRFMIGLMAVILLVNLMGCTRNTAKEEMRKYNMQAYQEGSRAAESQGRGLNGQFLDHMQGLFKDMNIQLTNETSAEDAAGNMSYQYRMNNDSSQLITVYVFSDEQERVNAMKELYGADFGNGSSKTNHNRVFGYQETALVYTSAGSDRDPYTDQVKKVVLELLGHGSQPINMK